MALALYRKYRPATFAQVVGQEHVTEPLRTSLRAGRINHAYLFSGPRGCGKTSSARILARSLNCAKGPTDEPCGECNSCIALAPNGPGSVDVIELDAASHGGVDDARELRDKAYYAPAEATYRVFIVDEAHMVTSQGFNALLKIVEEPPEHLVFVFATTEPDKVLPTIRSRTHHYPFRLIGPKPMRELLERNCAAEGVTVEPAVFPLVIRAGGGSARDTQSVLDQLLAGAGPEGVTYERAVNLLGVTDVALLDDMVDGLAAADGAAVFGTVERVVDSGHDPRRFAGDLLDRLRDLVLMLAVPDAAERGLINAPEDEVTRMYDQSRKLGQATLTRYAEIVHTGLTEMRGATAPRLLLELLCSRMMLPSSADTEAAVLQRVERLERRLTAGAPASQAPAAETPPKFQRPAISPEIAGSSTRSGESRSADAQASAASDTPAQAEAPRPSPAQAGDAQGKAGGAHGAAGQPVDAQAGARDVEAQRGPGPEAPARGPAAEEPTAAQETVAAEGKSNPGALDAAGVRRVWSEVLTAVRGSSRSVEAMLSAATVQSVDGDTIVLTHASAPLVKRLAEARNVDVVAGALRTALGGEWQVRWAEAGAAAPAPARPAQRSAPKPAPQRPSRPARPVDDIPPPDEPMDSEPPEPEEAQPAPKAIEPMDDEAMLSEAAQPITAEERQNQRAPEDAAIDLLSEHLGARKIEN